MKHDELQHSLAIHLTNDDNLVWENIPAGKIGSVRPDVYRISKSVTHPNPISYEIKVSVQDFRSDITTGKWKKYLDFSSGVVFATPKGLITKKDLPDGCGLIQFNGVDWNTQKRPTLHPLPAISSDLLLRLLIAGPERETNKPDYRRPTFNEELAIQKLKKKFGSDFQGKLWKLDGYDEKLRVLRELERKIGEITGVDPNRGFNFVADAKFAIEKILRANKESIIRESVANDLQKELETLQRRINQMIASIRK